MTRDRARALLTAVVPAAAFGRRHAPLPDSRKAVIGRGQVDWSALMAAAEKGGVAEYYVEDESTDPVRNAPQSVAYLETLRYPPRL